MYAGRASATPSMDMFMTLLSMGQQTWKQILQDRETLFAYLVTQVQPIASKYKERILQTQQRNHISICMTLDSVYEAAKKKQQDKETSKQQMVQEIGSRLFYRQVTGPRVVVPGQKKRVAGIDFVGYGAHHDAYPHCYLTMACAIGMTKQEVHDFVQILDQVLCEFV